MIFVYWFLLTLTVHILYKIVRFAANRHRSMGSRNKITSLKAIPESEELYELPAKWVPKNKHEVLKAKYKCLKKLFQIYDATLCAYPDAFAQENVEEEPTRRRRKRTHRAKADALVGTTSEDLSENGSRECAYKTKSVLKLNSHETVQEAVVCTSRECNTQTASLHPMHIPNLLLNDRRKLTRFQSFIHRMFGISNGTNVYSNHCRRRRNSFTIRRGSRMKRVTQSECALGNPAILSYVQNVQRYCLMDGTPRQCPIVGCKCMLYGIINYNDHLNLCHFPERKHICHYCHEGFDNEFDLFSHENEHLGLSKLRLNRSAANCHTRRSSFNTKVQDTQTDKTKTESDDKLKKIVSFFESIDPEVLKGLKNRSSECNLRNSQKCLNSGKRTMSCTNTLQTRYHKTNYMSTNSEGCFGMSCKSSLYEKASRKESDNSLSKPHISQRSRGSSSSNGTVVESSRSSETLKSSVPLSSLHSEDSLSCDPSTNIVYYKSRETTSKKESTMSILSQKLIKGIKSYKWEPPSKTIRV